MTRSLFGCRLDEIAILVATEGEIASNLLYLRSVLDFTSNCPEEGELVEMTAK